MSLQIIALSIGVFIVLALIGLMNFKLAMKQGKEIYCDVNCTDEEACNFFMKDQK